MSAEPRAKWRVVADVVFLIFGAFAGLFLLSAAFSYAHAKTTHPISFSWGTALVAVVVVTALLTRSRRYTRTQLGTAPNASTLVQALVGLAIGAGFAGLAVGITVLAGAGSIAGNTNVSVLAIIGSLANLIGAAIAEEVLFRSGLVGPLATVFPRWIAIAAPALLFGVVHLHNPGSSLFSTLSTTLAGLGLGLLFIDPAGSPTTPSLGLCTGLHAGWNFALGTVFGGVVSGYDLGPSLLRFESHDVRWSGGSYGVEAGLSSVIVWALLTGIGVYRSRARLGRAEER